MAIAVNGGHVARALDFYHTEGKYFIIGGTQPWENPATPTPPTINDFRLSDIIGLKKVDNTYMVVPTDDKTDYDISYREQNWKRVLPSLQTAIGASGVTEHSYEVPVTSTEGLSVGSKVRINNLYEGTIKRFSETDPRILILDVAAPEFIPAGSTVLGGALVEGAKYVYVECYLNYDEFPVEHSYRQIGLCTGITPSTEDVILPNAYGSITSVGVLEILDNRVATNRDISQREHISLIIEF